MFFFKKANKHLVQHGAFKRPLKGSKMNVEQTIL